MTRYEQAIAYHKQGYNCSQSILASFTDVTGLTTQNSFDLGAGFGAGAFTGELCGAISGAILVLGMANPVDQNDPVSSKHRVGLLSKELQRRFHERFGNLRCSPLLKTEVAPTVSPAAQAVGTDQRCEIIILSAMEIVEELLQERR